ncbi:MAG: DUF1801 domain-containing protein [Bacteroidales bacterium]|nr:DUF1801 domain-containing protein [Bacteroidales bacterium]
MQSNAKTVDQYISELPEDRKQIIADLVAVIRQNLPAGFSEGMAYGMLGWAVPHSLYPAGYHCDPKQPLPFLSLASQKNYISLYHMGLYEGALLDWFQEQWKSVTPKKLDMGKCCIRFKKAEDIPLSLIGELVTKISPADWISIYEKYLKKS